MVAARRKARVASLCILLLVAGAVLRRDVLAGAAETFEIAGRGAYLYAAPDPAEGKPWVWYAPTLKGISLVQRKVYFESFLRAGIGIAGFDPSVAPFGPGSTRP